MKDIKDKHGGLLVPVEFMRNSNMNSNIRVVSEAVSTAASKLTQELKYPEIALREAFDGVEIDVILVGREFYIDFKSNDISFKSLLALLMGGLNKLASSHAGRSVVVRASIPKAMPAIQRSILFEYLDDVCSRLEQVTLEYANIDRELIAVEGGMKIMAYT
ncbi:hypothetical protein VCHA53O466_50540 [Vibrio chagasii]|nr:hypothetical protein VCHA53O466_50540 [Vibrio chagasii]